MLGGGPRPSDAIESLAHETLGDVLRALYQPADLLLDLVAQALRVHILRQRRRDERVEERQGDPPDSALGGESLRELDCLDGAAHVLGSAGIAFQPLEQAALIAAALVTVILLFVPRPQGDRNFVAPRRPVGEIREVKVHGIGSRPAEHRHQFAVQRKQRERLVG